VITSINRAVLLSLQVLTVCFRVFIDRSAERGMDIGAFVGVPLYNRFEGVALRH
jgi:hypothetical protein